MSPDTDLSPAVVLLYLAAFAMAAAGVLLPLRPGKVSSDRRSRSAGRFLQALVITGIIPSLQVILDALEITPNLPGSWPQILNVILNALIIFGFALTVLAWSVMTRAFSPAALYSDSLRPWAFRICGGVTILAIVAQIAAIFRPAAGLIGTAGTVLLIFMAVLGLIIIDGSVRLLRSGHGVGWDRQGIILNLLLPAVLIFTVLYTILPDRPAALLPPVTLIILFSASILLYVRQSATSEDSESLTNQILEDSGLTTREREIALMLAEGLSYKEISGKLFVSLSTIQTHVTRIYGKLEVKSKTELSRKISGS